MNATERRTIRQAIARLQTGDRSGAREVLAALVMPRGKEPDREQLVFAVVRFTCPRLHVEMTMAECVQARASVWPSGGRRGALKRAECVGCLLGEAHAFACPGIVLRKPWQPTFVLPLSQRMAKRARALVDPDVRVDMDPMREAAMASPDDSGEWR